MNNMHLNEHDANQGAQSTGEFLGMKGNSGWWLFGSGGATIIMVVFLWGILGMSLLLCLLIGIVLCALSLAYVFTLKNNKPEHYDVDFFESVLAEAGVVEMRFGPRVRRIGNPFSVLDSDADNAAHEKAKSRSECGSSGRKQESLRPAVTAAAQTQTVDSSKSAKAKAAAKTVTAVPDALYEAMQEELEQTKELLDEALAEPREN